MGISLSLSIVFSSANMVICVYFNLVNIFAYFNLVIPQPYNNIIYILNVQGQLANQQDHV